MEIIHPISVWDYIFPMNNLFIVSASRLQSYWSSTMFWKPCQICGTRRMRVFDVTIFNAISCCDVGFSDPLKTPTTTRRRSLRYFGRTLTKSGPFKLRMLQYLVINIDGTTGKLGSTQWHPILMFVWFALPKFCIRHSEIFLMYINAYAFFLRSMEKSFNTVSLSQLLINCKFDVYSLVGLPRATLLIVYRVATKVMSNRSSGSEHTPSKTKTKKLKQPSYFHCFENSEDLSSYPLSFYYQTSNTHLRVCSTSPAKAQVKQWFWF